MFIQQNGHTSNSGISQEHYEPGYIVEWDIVNFWLWLPDNESIIYSPMRHHSACL